MYQVMLGRWGGAVVLSDNVQHLALYVSDQLSKAYLNCFQNSFILEEKYPRPVTLLNLP